MARKGRGGFRAPELRGTLGTLIKTTRDVLERGAREGRERLDEVMAGRRRSEALAELGEIVLDLVRRGEIDVDELPEARDVIAHIDQLDAGTEDEPRRRHLRRSDAHLDEVARAPTRERFDDRGRASLARAGQDDGTVASRTWAPPSRSPAATKVWRPPPGSVPSAVDEPAPPHAAAPPPRRKGGISFTKDQDSDDDLADYMHPDDVPPKPSSDS